MMKLARFNRMLRTALPSRTLIAACVLLSLACVSLGIAPSARAQFDDEGGTIKLKDLGSGVLDVKYFNEQSASGNGGCLHVEVLSPSGPSPSDRNLEIVFYVNFLRSGPNDGTAYRFPVSLPEGSGRVVAALPYVSSGQSNHPGNQALVSIWDVAVFEDGHNVEAMRTYSGSRGRASAMTVQPGGRNSYHVTASNGSGWSMLRLVEDTVMPTSLQPEMYRLLSATDRSNNALSQSVVSKTNFGLSSDWQNVANIRTLSSAPEKWLYYLQFNYVAIDETALARVRSERPGVSQALKQYVAAGGSVLLLSAAQGGQELIDQWLSEASPSPTAAPSAASKPDAVKPAAAKPDAVKSPPAKSAAADAATKGDWQKISAPVEEWWNRPVTLVPASAGNQSQAGAGGMTTLSLATPTTPYGSAPGTPGAPYTLEVPVEQITSATTYSVAPMPAYEPAPLTVGGCARDLLTALETYSMAEFGTPLIVADKWVEVVTGNGDTMVMSQGYTGMGMPLNVSAIPFDLIELFDPLQARLEDKVSELQQQDTIGCSLRSYALGQIGVVQSSLNAQPLEPLTQLIGALSSSAAMRVSSALDSAWSWRNLISSVGKPPVWTFCAFVLLFGLLLGPGLLVFTGWMGRRSLLIFLVPCVSLVATISIAAYEILHEGFDTSIRISSVLAIDEPTGQGFAWSRQTYFSGWPPRGGLEFPSDVYFRSVNERQEYYRSSLEAPQRSIDNNLHIVDDRSRWTGWLSAREQQQLLIGHPAKLSPPLHATRVDPRRVKIKNLTDEVLPFAAVRDEGDSYYLATDLMPGAEVACEAQTAYEVGIELTRIRAKHIPEAPIEMQGGSGFGWSRRYVSYATDASLSEVLDVAWHQYVSEYLSLPRYGFVTLQASTDAVYVPLEGKVTESKHLVVGRLVW